MGRDCLRVDAAYAELLSAVGLARVEDVLRRTDGRVAAWSRTTDTVHVPGTGATPGFYVKRYYYPRWRNRLRGMLRGTLFGQHRGLAEYRALRTMRALGIAAVRPVAVGSRRVGRFLSACFLITEEVPEACNLTTFASEVQRGQRLLSRKERRTLGERLADQVAHMHARGFAHGQLFWRNVLVRSGPDGAPEFLFLDAAPPRRWARLTCAAWLRDLSHTAASAAPFTSRTERLRFLLRYMQADRLTPEIKAHWRAIERGARYSASHERQRVKMNDLFESWNRQLAAENRTWSAGGAVR